MKQLQIVCLNAISLVMIYCTSLLAMPAVLVDEEESVDATPMTPSIPTSTQKTAQPGAASFEAVPSPSIAGSGPVQSFSNEGPNTVDQDESKIGTHGNWVKKKDFLMRSFDVQKEIEALATTIQSYRSIYQQKFGAIDQELDSFYKQLGLEQSKIQDLFTQLEEYIEQKKQRRIARFKRDITEIREQQMAIEHLEETLKANRNDLTQLKNDMKTIEDLDKSVSTRMQRADEQIATAQREAARSKDIVQSMWDMLDDKLAKAAYFELKDGILRRLQTIDAYLQQELLQDLEKVGASISDQIKKARESVKNLEDKGFLIRDRSKRLDELNVKKAKEAAELLEQERQTHKRAKIAESKGFFQKVYDGVVNFIASIYRFFSGLFGSGEPAIRARVRQRPATEQLPVKAPVQAMPTTTPTAQQIPQMPAMPAQPVAQTSAP